MKILFTFLIITISFSRIYLGVHDISDVIGGIIIGLISIFLLNNLLGNKGAWIRNQSHLMHCLMYLCFFSLFYLAWPLEENRIVAVTLGSLIMGFWIGQTIDKKYFNFESPKNLLLKILSAILAVFGFIQLNKNIDQILEMIQLNHTIETIASSLLLGLYISLIAPFILSLMRLQKIRN